MQTVLSAGFDYTMLVDFNYGNGDNIYRMDLIHLNSFRKPTAFDSKLCVIDDKDIKNIRIGDVGLYVPAKPIKHSDWTETVPATWRKDFKYLDHNFELATLLGVEKNGNMRVFGNKINEKILSVSSRDTAVGFKRGDNLLIEMTENNQYKFVHNIDQELLKFNRQQLMTKSL